MFTISVSVLILFLVLILVYFRFKFKNELLEKLKGVNYLLIAFVYWMFHLNSTGGIIFFPHFYRIGGGIWMLSAVLLYYCARLVFQKPLTWKELLILLPVLLYFINFAPFIFQNTEYKVEVIKQVLSKETVYSFDEGWLFSGKFILFLRIFHRILCTVLIGTILWKNRQQKSRKYGNETIVYFYFWFVLLSSMPELFPLFEINVINGILISSYLYVIMAFSFLILFFLSPRLLYGTGVDFNKRSLNENLKQVDINQSDTSLQKVLNDKDNLTPKQRADLLKIEFYLNHNNACLDVNFSLGQLENETGITSKRISQCIKLKYQLNFAQFINKRRIKYCLEKLEVDKKWRNYSVEALALNVGFNSTNSFYNYFKNYTGKTPREFIDSLV